MEEQWKDIFGYEGLYQVSNLGRVRSLIKHNGTDERILKPKNDKGYLRIKLCNNGSKKLFCIHRLVAQAFIPNDDLFKTDINHKDENKENNVWTNLEWCDKTYNNNYGRRNEKSSKSQINDPNKSKQINQYSLDGVFIQSFPSAKEIQRELGFHSQNISDCCKGKLKTSNGFIWKYKNDDE